MLCVLQVSVRAHRHMEDLMDVVKQGHQVGQMSRHHDLPKIGLWKAILWVNEWQYSGPRDGSNEQASWFAKDRTVKGIPIGEWMTRFRATRWVGWAGIQVCLDQNSIQQPYDEWMTDFQHCKLTFLHDTRGRCVPELVCRQLCAGMTNYRTTFLHDTCGRCVPELVCRQLCAGITNYRTTFSAWHSWQMCAWTCVHAIVCRPY